MIHVKWKVCCLFAQKITLKLCYYFSDNSWFILHEKLLFICTKDYVETLLPFFQIIHDSFYIKVIVHLNHWSQTSLVVMWNKFKRIRSITQEIQMEYDWNVCDFLFYLFDTYISQSFEIIIYYQVLNISMSKNKICTNIKRNFQNSGLKS